jgi:hypothetical protein
MDPVEPQPVPDELWVPLARNYGVTRTILFCASGTFMVTSGLSLLDTFLHPFELFTPLMVRLVLPLMIAGAVTWGLAMLGQWIILRRMRKLMIHYHRIDPGGP